MNATVSRGPAPEGRKSATNTAARAAEFLAMFVVAPTVLSLVIRPGLLFPALWALGAICLTVLLRDPAFDRRRLWGWPAVRPVLAGLLIRFVLGAALLAAALPLAEPDSLLHLPRSRPGLWAVIMVLYPVLSVYPQEVAFRAFFFHRFAELFRSQRAMILASALAFGFAHVILRNWWAIGFCTVGGMLFAWTYARSRSLAAACFEHALYGCFVFTIGWGPHFYSGTIR